MRLLSFFTVEAFFAATASWAFAQAGQPQVATTVQLPTISVFSVQTTVSVPDGGRMSLGGIDRGVDSTVNRRGGLLPNRGIGSSRSASGISVSATIIDNQEIDRAILAAAAAKHLKADDTLALKAADLSKSVGNSQAMRSSPDSVADIRQQNAAMSARQALEQARLFAKAQEAEAEGKTGVAKIYYQMVARGNHAALKAKAQERLAAMASGKSIVQR
jgi:hypothetical protein